MNTIWLAFLAGLTTGGISCLAVQGGLLASTVSPSSVPLSGTSEGKQQNISGRWSQVGMFLLAKFVAYVLLGFALGAIGSTLLLTPRMLGFVQIAAGLFMLATAARIAEIHPIFRYAVITPPRWTYRLLRKFSRDSSWFAPALLGFFTILMPCGVTQATMVIAVASGSPFLGAGIMGAFILGTSPIFLFLGATVLELLKRKAFSVIAAAVVASFAILSINGGIGLTGSFYTLSNIYKAAMMSDRQLASRDQGAVAGLATDGVQNVTIKVRSNGYTANASTLKAGVPVRLRLVSEDVRGCARGFTIPSLNISKVLPVTGDEEIDFTPKNTGTLTYACSMGMYTGTFTVTL